MTTTTSSRQSEGDNGIEHSRRVQDLSQRHAGVERRFTRHSTGDVRAARPNRWVHLFPPVRERLSVCEPRLKAFTWHLFCLPGAASGGEGAVGVDSIGFLPCLFLNDAQNNSHNRPLITGIRPKKAEAWQCRLPLHGSPLVHRHAHEQTIPSGLSGRLRTSPGIKRWAVVLPH